MKFLDLNGDNVVNDGAGTLDNPGDRVKIGNSNPRYTYGLNLAFEWLGFDVSAFFQGVGHQDWYPANDNIKFWGPYVRPFASFIPRNFMSDVGAKRIPMLISRAPEHTRPAIPSILCVTSMTDICRTWHTAD